MGAKKRKTVPQKRGIKGEGGVYPDKRRGGYFGKVPVGKYENGRTRYTEVRGDTQAEVVEKKRLVLPPDPNAVTVGEWCARWVAGLAKRAGTNEVYAGSMRRRVVPSLGHVRLKDLTVSQVKAAAASWKGLKPQTVNLTLDRAATMFGAAVVEGLVASNPFALCPRFEYHRKPIDPFTPDELRRIIADRGRSMSGPLLALLAATGMRIGEGAALEVTDYDRGTGRLSISKTFSPSHGIGPPKSKNGRRVLALPPQACAVVEEAIGTRTTGVLFPSERGNPSNYARVSRHFREMLDALGIRRRVPHAMRHGVATSLVSAGVPLGDVARWLGDSVATVVATYLHPSGADVGATLGGILGADR